MTLSIPQRAWTAGSAKPQIVATDVRAMNPGDLDDAELRALGEVKVYDRSDSELVERCQNADIVLVNKSLFTSDTLKRLPRLKFIAVTATGCNTVDLAAARALGIAVSNVPNYSSAAVAQHVFAMLLEMFNRTTAHAEACRAGLWSGCGHFSFTLGPIHELAGKRLGIVGCGAIGSRVAGIGRALEMDVVALKSERAPKTPTEFPRVSLEELFASSDVLSLHCPLTPETENLINANSLALMKPSAVLINTGRGPLVDEVALAAALRAGTLSGACLDVLRQEPPPADHPLLSEPRCLITPHLAWASVEARTRLLSVTTDNVRAFLRGGPQNVVNP